MTERGDYLSLSKRFLTMALRASDPRLAEAYRQLAQTYRTLDIWHERFKQRYEWISEDDTPGDKRPEL